MKGVYWRANNPKPLALLLVTLVAVAAVTTAELVQAVVVLPHREEKLAAARHASHAFDVLRNARLKRGLGLDVEVDPTRSGLIGASVTPITTEAGILSAKQTSINPNFAAVVLALLYEAGVHRGDTVAIYMTGSLPAFNVAVLAALEALDVTPLYLVSAGASQWGANEPQFSWPDMLAELLAQNVFSHPPLAAARGGKGDVARGMSPAAQATLDRAIENLHVPLLRNGHAQQQVEASYLLLRQASHGRPIKAFINVGGGLLSMGLHAPQPTFTPGINRRLREGVARQNSLMQRFLDQQVPVLHMHHAKVLAARYGLPETPQVMPVVGEGGIYQRTGYSRWVAAASLAALLVAMAAVFRRQPMA